MKPPCLADFSLNWTMRCSSPTETVHSMIQHSWECSGEVALHEDGRHVGVEADGVQRRRQLQRLATDHAGFLGHRQGVQVDDAVEGVARVLADHPVPQRAQVVAEVDLAGGLDARQDPGHGRSG